MFETLRPTSSAEAKVDRINVKESSFLTDMIPPESGLVFKKNGDCNLNHKLQSPEFKERLVVENRV